LEFSLVLLVITPVYPHNLRHAPRIDGGLANMAWFSRFLAWRGCQCSREKAVAERF
jgi:hypothetical protein